MPDRERVVGHLNDCMEASRRDNTWVFVRKDIVEDTIALLKEQPEIVRCKDCVYHENEKARSNQTAWLPCMEIQTKNNWYCADGEKDEGQIKRPKETFWDYMSEAELIEPMHHFQD